MFDVNHASLNDWLARLEQLHPTEIDLGLTRVGQVAKRLNCLKPAPLVIVVGGTNGKGTTSAFISALLMAQGLKVGQYNSPHIHRYNERVRINEQEASDADICRSFQTVEAQRQNTSLTYFEFGTLAALEYFKQQQVDACVLEIGLGGRLDAVNIVDSDIAVVTSVGLDHQAFLGNTLEQIAYEKCSIARAGKYLVCGQINPPATAFETVQKLGGKWCARNQDFFIEQNSQGLLVRFTTEQMQEWQLPKAHIPHHNVATALQTLALINQLPSQQLTSQVLSNLRVPGRLQHFQRGDLTLILDVAHNEQAAAYIGEALPKVDGLILGMLADKEPDKVFPVLPKAKRLILVGLDGHRGQSAAQLLARAEFSPKPELKDNVAAAMATLPNHGCWLICGSFHTVDAALEVINQEGTWSHN